MNIGMHVDRSHLFEAVYHPASAYCLVIESKHPGNLSYLHSFEENTLQ